MSAKSASLLRIKIGSAVGDTAAQRALEDAFCTMDATEITEEGVIFAFDLADIEFATTSFVKGSILALFQSGRLSTDPSTLSATESFGIPIRNVFPVVANANRELESLVDEIFGRRNLPLLSIKFDRNGHVHDGRMLGNLDEALLRTMRYWKWKSPVSAADLRSSLPNEGISQTAWSNRLNDLWRLRLLRRRRKGKSWLYKPVMEEIKYG